MTSAPRAEGQPTRIQRKRTKGWKMPENTVYVGRPSKWGNPFEVIYETGKWPGYGGWAVYFGSDLRRGYYEFEKQARIAAVEEYRHYIEDFDFDEWNLKFELGGKNLACWCPPDQACHADVLLELLA